MTMQTMPTRQQIAAAEPLDFPDRRPAKQDLTITIHARVDGFDTEVCFSGSMDQLLSLTKRLRTLGAEPVSAPAVHTAPIGNGNRPKAEPPVYNDAGEECCPTHNKRPLKGPNGWGKLFCSAKDGDAYCKYTWKAES